MSGITEQVVFVESGVWRKPEGATWVHVEIVGGAAGDADGGKPGGPGQREGVTARAEWLPNEVNVSVGKSPPDRGDRVGSGHGWVRVTTYFGEAAPEARAEDRA